MTNFTEKQQRYVAARISGLNKTKSAVHAGYSRAGADRQASLLEKRADIKKAIAAGKRTQSQAVGQVESILGVPDKSESRLKKSYPDSLSFMLDAMNNPKLPDSLRFEAAKQALPYQHARVEPAGKKQNAKERAKEIANGTVSAKPGAKPKFSTKSAPPKLTSIAGGKA